MSQDFVLGIDQGTSGSRAIVMDVEGLVRGYAYQPLPRHHPRPDWVEQDPLEVAAGVMAVAEAALAQAGCDAEDLAGCGLTGQRNSDFVWDSQTGRPLAPAITWQDMRTMPWLERLVSWPPAAEARHRLGYPPAPYMSALHLAWRLQHQAAVREAARAGRLRLGMSPAWLLSALGQPSGHKMDRSLIQATGLYDIRQDRYWEEWCAWLGLPNQAALPQPAPTLHNFGHIRLRAAGGRWADVPVLAMIGDQQAALFGHDCRTPGAAECTHGTASYLEVFLGATMPEQAAVDTLYAWDLSPVAPETGQTYCLEAQTTVTGAGLRWLRDDAGVLPDYEAIDGLAAAVSDSGGVVFVPAFTGLNVPDNDRSARGTILGLSLGSRREHLVVAFLEAVGCQLRVLVDLVAASTGTTVSELHVGGGLAASDAACQIQADILERPVLRPPSTETTARAAALLAGLGAGLWSHPDELPRLPGPAVRFDPRPGSQPVARKLADWRRAVAVARSWSEDVAVSAAVVDGSDGGGVANDARSGAGELAAGPGEAPQAGIVAE